MNTRIPDADGTHRLGGTGDHDLEPVAYDGQGAPLYPHQLGDDANPETRILTWLDDNPDVAVLPVGYRPARTFQGWLQRGGYIVQVDTDGNVRRARPLGVVVDDTPPDYFAPAAADPSRVHRFPRPVTLTREELGILEAGSPIRAYLNRHAAEALVEREHVETRLQDATRDLENAVRRQQMIERALADLDELEKDNGHLRRLIVGPVTSPSPTTQEKS